MPVVSLEIGGNSEQETREGYNKIEVNTNNYTTNGITVTNNGDGSLTLNGTNTSGTTAYIRLNADNINVSKDTYFNLIKDKNYYMDLCNTTLPSGVSLIARDRAASNPFISTTTSSIKTWTSNTTEQAIAFLKIEADVVLNNLTIRPILAESDIELEYEAYGAMPSPSYPSEIETVGDNVNILETNLFTTTKLNGVDFKNNEDGTYTLDGTATENAFYTKQVTLEAGDYTLSGCPADGAQDKYALQVLGYGEGDFGKGQTFTLTEETTVPIRLMVWSGVTIDNLVFKPKLEKGKLASAYSSYNMGCASVVVENEDGTEQQTKVVDIQQEMLEGDYFIKEVDGWKEVHGWDYDTFKTNSYGLNNDGTKRIKITAWGFQNKADCKVLCRYFKSKYARWDDNNQIDNAIYGWNEYGAIGINFSKEQFSSIEEFSTWASEVNLGFYYQLATPTKLTCTEKQSAQLDDLLNTSTYKNVTHIYSTDKVSPIIKVVYRKDTPTLLNNIFKNII